MTEDQVTAVLVTRGDREEGLQEIIASLIFDEVLIWNNASPGVPDLGAYGRYAAAVQAETPFVYLQDDDCLVSAASQYALLDSMTRDPVEWLSNMPPDHNAGMPLLALPGWGALTSPAAINRAIAKWPYDRDDDWLRIGCDIVIPVLTPSRMIDLGHESFGYAYGEDRTHRRRDYVGKKQWYYREAAGLRGPVEAAA